MVDQEMLLKDLQKQVKLLEDDLRERGQDPTAIKGVGPNGEPESFDAYLKREYQKARDAERVGIAEGEWREGQITQAAVAWVLSTVFVRFCEDNGLLEQPFIAGPKDERDRYGIAQELKEAWVLQGRRENLGAPELTDREWLEHAFEQMSVSSVMAGLFDRQHNPMWTITPSHTAAKQLIDFWRQVGEDGHLVHDFTDPEWNTRFLGDLYQDLSEATRKKYALLQTPEFVEEFILDYTLEPAIEEFGLDGNRIYQEDSKGFRLIDPTCGSGHFLLGAFHRLLNKWREAEPGASDWDLINRSLRSVHGVDKNPYAVAIARFRLLIAAMKEGGITALSASNPEWPIVVATGDSLIHGRGAPGEQRTLFGGGVHYYTTEDVHEYVFEHNLLGMNSYHAVVGNPPYITVKDKQENQNYREAYKQVCSGKYALSVPFAQRFFDLAKLGSGSEQRAGYTGQITANSFMKREFGKKLIEDYFHFKVDLTHVIDASGAYIPGHGTPTVILFGRNRMWRDGSKIRTILGIRGEPSQPKVPSEGLVWSAIANQVGQPGSESEWVTSVDLGHGDLRLHPWSLTGGRAGGLKKSLEIASKGHMETVMVAAGITSVTGEDDLYLLDTSGSQVRLRVDETKPLVTGDVVRDYSHSPSYASVWVYEKDFSLTPLRGIPGTWRMIWPYRSSISKRKRFGVPMLDRGMSWYEWQEVYPEKLKSPLSIVFAFVATHNHFVLDRGGKVFKQSAPVIKLPKDATEDQHLELLGVLNSSAACFWLKQVSQSKGNGGVGGGISDELWEHRYEFTGTKLKEFPLPAKLPLARSKEIDSLAQKLSLLEPAALAESATPTAEVLRQAHDDYVATRRRMIALQEELDWDVYHRYALISDAQLTELTLPDTADVPSINLGERAFEIVLARKMAAGEASTEWFNRHGSTPITEIPSHWPDAYKKVVAKRIELIESDKNINLLERPDYKRRWQSEPWEKKQQAALKSWLLDKCEDRRLWFVTDDHGDERARPLSVRVLANRVRDLFPEAAEVAALYDSAKDFGEVVAEIVKTEHVPYLAALRYKDSGMRKRTIWEQVWDLQREEDALNADLAEGEKEHRLDIPVPPKYTSADFRRGEYWSNRGKLDVPKERFVSYPGAETDADSTLLLGWAGWDHAQQADALGTLAHERMDELGWGKDEGTRDKMTPLLAGMLELLPWVTQWHTRADDYGDTPADHLREDLAELRDTTGITESEMTDWRPPASTRGRKKKA
ncbi:BREX-2 system adenine-specific DNA-methyltransferase PglX [Nocardiopsis alkaliphila]|uniref:BREX-2 system adenine-specific DNA-methyltransferase PglX n=1 Tax=Nocardiopsis alkaliphila TaxID=225762 RepID=UPI00034876EF|nr:BREX-2 system adenine-specific DNA-methyltransferase PglX [Nocardiopsis alkaliphila]